jgi:hypothetical protein
MDDKTVGRWLIAKHRALDALQRLHSRQRDICEMSFETIFTHRVTHKLLTQGWVAVMFWGSNSAFTAARETLTIELLTAMRPVELDDAQSH